MSEMDYFDRLLLSEHPELDPKVIKRKFKKRMKNLTDEELEELDTEWMDYVLPSLSDFYGGYHPTGRNADLKKQKYEDYLYMYYITHPDREWDERYDQPIFSVAQMYAEGKTKRVRA